MRAEQPLPTTSSKENIMGEKSTDDLNTYTGNGRGDALYSEGKRQAHRTDGPVIPRIGAKPTGRRSAKK
jgi:hypothetical protein